jgi:hypothetical protein
LDGPLPPAGEGADEEGHYARLARCAFGLLPAPSTTIEPPIEGLFPGAARLALHCGGFAVELRTNDNCGSVWTMKLRLDLLEHLSDEDILEEVLANNHRYKPEPLFSKTGVGSLSSASIEERAQEEARSTARIQRARQRLKQSGAKSSPKSDPSPKP